MFKDVWKCLKFYSGCNAQIGCCFKQYNKTWFFTEILFESIIHFDSSYRMMSSQNSLCLFLFQELPVQVSVSGMTCSSLCFRNDLFKSLFQE